MDPGAVEQMGNSIGEAGTQIQDLYDKARARVEELEWTGEDRDRFVADLDGSVGSAVARAITQAGVLKDRALANATAQRSASA
jgi:hypothetical protein